MKRAILAVALLVVPCTLSLGGQPQGIKTLRIDYTIVRESKDVDGRTIQSIVKQTRFIAPDGRERIEEIDPRMSRHEARILDLSRGVVIQLDLNRKIARRDAASEAKAQSLSGLHVEALASPNQAQLGVYIIQGFQCKGSRSIRAGSTEELSACRDPITGLVFLGRAYLELADGKVWRQDIEKVTRDFVVDPQLFEVPPDFQTSGE